VVICPESARELSELFWNKAIRWRAARGNNPRVPMREIESVSERINLMWRCRSIFSSAHSSAGERAGDRSRPLRPSVITRHWCGWPRTCRFWASTIFVSALVDRCDEAA
jgi:hypothetical protein